MTTISQYRQMVDQKKAQRDLLEKQISEERARQSSLATDLENITKARALLQEAALMTQENLRVCITAIGTSALQAIFRDREEPLYFHAAFETKRGKTECRLAVGEGANLSDPMDSHGGGVADVLSFALRASFWSLKKIRPVLILDEPLKFLSRDLIPLAADMVNMLSRKLGLQFLIVTHEPEFIHGADRVFRVTRSKGVSYVEQDPKTRYDHIDHQGNTPVAKTPGRARRT